MKKGDELAALRVPLTVSRRPKIGESSLGVGVVRSCDYLVRRGELLIDRDLRLRVGNVSPHLVVRDVGVLGEQVRSDGVGVAFHRRVSSMNCIVAPLDSATALINA